MNDFYFCIACLTVDVKMCSILNTQLCETYEKLANIEVYKEDGLPKTICNVCCSQLKKCYKFMKMSQKASMILAQLHNDGVQITQETVSALALDERITNNFVTTITKPTNVIYSYSAKEEKNIEAPSNKDDHKNTTFDETCVTIFVKKEPEEPDILPDIAEEFPIKVEVMKIEVEPTIIQESKQVKRKNVKINKEITNKVKAAIKDHIKGKTVSDLKPKDKNNVTPIKIEVKKKGNKTEKKNYVCNRCGVAFSYDFYLKRHMLTHTGEKRYACNNCDKKFSQNVHLVQHMRVHTGEKPYVCNICPDKAFNHGYNYKIHMSKHSGVRPHKCNLCDSAFHQKADLQRHMRTHTGEKPYTCSTCHMKFSQNGHLNQHMKIHSNDKPYICDICKQSYTQKAHLKYHIAIHIGEKPYPCTFKGCSKAFNTKSTYSNHLRVHTGERPFGCDKCYKTFKQKGHLTTHFSLVHARQEIEDDLLAIELQQAQVAAPLNINEEFIIP